MNLEDMVVSEISQSDKDKYHMISLIICGIKEKVELIEAESTTVVTRPWRVSKTGKYW